MTEKVLKVRASSWGTLFDCASRWEAIHLLGMRMASSPPALLGNGVHAGSAAFDKATLAGRPISVGDAVDVMQDYFAHPPEEVDWSPRRNEFSRLDVEQIGFKLLTRYCREVAPTLTFHSVELALEPLSLKCPNGWTVQLTGTMDRARVRTARIKRTIDITAKGNVLSVTEHQVGVSDLKTGRRAIAGKSGAYVASTKNHKPQLGCYELQFEQTTGIAITAPAEIIAMKTTREAVIARADITGAKTLMLGDGKQLGLVERASRMAASGDFHPNPLSPLCSARYCPRWQTCLARS
jgi:hypothetical protein